MINRSCAGFFQINWKRSVALTFFGKVILLKYTMLFSAVLLSLASFAQDCSKELLLQKAGVWKANPQGSTFGIATADLVKQKKVVGAIHAMIQSKYLPMGVEAGFNGSYTRAEANMAGNGYYYSIIPKNYYCDGDIIRKAHETSTLFSINANMFNAEIYDTAQGDRLLGEGFNVMQDMPVEKDGYWFFKEIDAGLGFGMTGKSGTWLITYDGKLPYTYVTKKEFLEKRRKALLELMNMSASGIEETLKNNEITKGFKETAYKNDPAKLEKYMKMDYRQIKERYEKFLANNEKDFKPAFDKIDAQLKMPAAELNQQAIVTTDPKDHLSYLFTDYDDPFGKILIKPNPGYFNKKLARSSPQFFWVSIRYNHKEPIATKVREDIMKAIDFAALKNMLGK